MDGRRRNARGGDGSRKLKGLLTTRDARFAEKHQKVTSRMTRSSDW